MFSLAEPMSVHFILCVFILYLIISRRQFQLRTLKPENLSFLICSQIFSSSWCLYAFVVSSAGSPVAFSNQNNDAMKQIIWTSLIVGSLLFCMYSLPLRGAITGSPLLFVFQTIVFHFVHDFQTFSYIEASKYLYLKSICISHCFFHSGLSHIV